MKKREYLVTYKGWKKGITQGNGQIVMCRHNKITGNDTQEITSYILSEHNKQPYNDLQVDAVCLTNIIKLPI